MKTPYIFLSFALCLLAVSCNKSEHSIESPAQDGQIVFTASGDGINTEVSTKAAAVTTLDSFNVCATAGTTETAVSGFANIVFTKSGTSYKGGKYWPSTDQKYNFYASNVTLGGSPMGSTVTVANANTDVIVAKKAYSAADYKNACELAFEHIFARIGNISIAAPSGYTIKGTPTLALSAPVSGTYNLSSKSWTSKGTAAAQTLATGAAGASKANDVYVVPGTYELSVTYTLALGDYEETFTKKASVNLAQGKISSITATAPAGSASEIVLTVSIADWGTANLSVDLS